MVHRGLRRAPGDSSGRLAGRSEWAASAGRGAGGRTGGPALPKRTPRAKTSGPGKETASRLVLRDLVVSDASLALVSDGLPEACGLYRLAVDAEELFGEPA